MNTLRSIFALVSFSLATSLFAQPSDLVGSLNFKVQQIDGKTWGVFVKPDNTIAPSTRTVTGSGQVTLVAPIDFTYASLENFGGSWVENARVDGPIEASEMSYVSFGFVTDSPKLNVYPNQETLLFTFSAGEEFWGTFSLIENNNDPFSVPNSYESNPGNDLGVIDYGVEGGLQWYTYAGNYAADNAAPAAIFASKKADKKNNRGNNDTKVVLAGAQPK